MTSGCDKILEAIWEYIDDEMDHTSMAEIKQHLDLCRSCYTRMEFEKKLRDHMKTNTEKTCPDRLRKKIQEIIDLY